MVGDAEVDFHGKKRSNATHRSTKDGEARLHRKGKGQPALLYHMGHAVTENRNGLIMAVAVTEASGTAEPAAAEEMVDELRDRFGICVKTLVADKNYDGGPPPGVLRELVGRQVRDRSLTSPDVTVLDASRGGPSRRSTSESYTRRSTTEAQPPPTANRRSRSPSGPRRPSKTATSAP